MKVFHDGYRYVVTDEESITVRSKTRKAGIERFRRLKWEQKEYACGRYIVNDMTGEILYSQEAAKLPRSRV